MEIRARILVFTPKLTFNDRSHLYMKCLFVYYIFMRQDYVW